MTAAQTETAMAAAFLKALAKWSARHTNTDKITLPTGTVAGSELEPVLRALGFRGESPPPTDYGRMNGGRSIDAHKEA